MRTRALAIVVVGLAGCGHKDSGADVEARGTPGEDDCKVVLADPAKAVAVITQRYPKDAVKVAEVIEHCVAPAGDECERMAKIVAAIPSMMPAGKAPSGDVVASCRDMPPEMRRCMFPSYALAHADECRKAYDTIASTAIDAIAIKPGGARVPSCEPVALAVRADGLWLATRAGGRCFRARTQGELDLAWLETELKSALGQDCAPSTTIAAAADSKYAEVIAVMDVAIKVGIVDVSLGAMNELPVKLDGDPTKDGAHCPAIVVSKQPAKPVAPAVPPPPPPPLPPSSGGSLTAQVPLQLPPVPDEALKKLPVVVVTRDELIVGGTHLASIAELTKGKGQIAALVAAVPSSPADHRIIIQADQNTDMNVLVRVLDTVKGRGYDSVMFAVKNK